jgi:hypothetical protein
MRAIDRFIFAAIAIGLLVIAYKLPVQPVAAQTEPGNGLATKVELCGKDAWTAQETCASFRKGALVVHAVDDQ